MRTRREEERVRMRLEDLGLVDVDADQQKQLRMTENFLLRLLVRDWVAEMVTVTMMMMMRSSRSQSACIWSGWRVLSRRQGPLARRAPVTAKTAGAARLLDHGEGGVVEKSGRGRGSGRGRARGSKEKGVELLDGCGCGEGWEDRG